MACQQRIPEVSGAAVAIEEVLTKHAKSYNTDRSGVGYVVCRCGLAMELDGSSGADDARTLAAHQARELDAMLILTDSAVDAAHALLPDEAVEALSKVILDSDLVGCGCCGASTEIQVGPEDCDVIYPAREEALARAILTAGYKIGEGKR